MGCYTWNWMHIRVHNENNACSELLALMKKVRDRVGENPECEPNERSYNIVRDGKKFNLANECEFNAYKNNENAAWKQIDIEDSFSQYIHGEQEPFYDLEKAIESSAAKEHCAFIGITVEEDATVYLNWVGNVLHETGGLELFENAQFYDLKSWYIEYERFDDAMYRFKENECNKIPLHYNGPNVALATEFIEIIKYTTDAYPGSFWGEDDDGLPIQHGLTMYQWNDESISVVEPFIYEDGTVKFNCERISIVQ